MDDFGAAVLSARRAKRYKQNELAEMVGISPAYMNQIESGKRSVENLDEKFFNKLVKFLPELEKFRPGKMAPMETDLINNESIEDGSTLDVERAGWQKMEVILRETIEEQKLQLRFYQEQIKFLTELIKSSKTNTDI